MKRILRSKLILSLAAIVMIAAAIAIPLSGSIARSHAQSASSSPPVSISSIKGTFYPNPNNSGTFDPSVLSSPVFSQQFPVISFDPPSSAQVSCSNTTGVDENTRPFTDVVPNLDGTCSTLVAQDPNNSSNQAGQGNLFMFQATFIANLTVANAGDVTFNFFSDDGWILASGPEASNPIPANQPTYVSGSLVNAPASGYITNFPVVGSFNQPSSPAQNTVTVHFPVSGTFPIEVDYTECCGGPETLVLGTSFGNPIPPPPPPSRKQLFILLQGITSSLVQGQINANEKPGFDGPGGISANIRRLFPHASILSYSYNGINSNGSLKPYSCADTITPSLTDEITSLSDEINNALKSNPNTDVYLVGHSLGGDVAFGYAAELLANPKLLPTGAKLKAVITLDAQLGGLKPSLTYDSIETIYFLVRCFAVFPHIMLTPANLTAVFRSAASTPLPEDGPRGSDPQGAQANILTNTDLSNENIAEQLLAAGTSFLSIGATNDFLHNPKSCLSIAPNFIGTQFLEDEGHGSGLYGRSFVAMSNGKPLACHQISSKAFSCIQPLNPLDPFTIVEAAKQLACLAKEGTKFILDIVAVANDINHSHQAVRTDPNVITAINNFLTSIPATGVGGTPSPLAPVPGKDTGAQ